MILKYWLYLDGSSGGGDTFDATATVDDVLYPKTFYAKDGKKTGNIHTVVDGIITEASCSFAYSNSIPSDVSFDGAYMIRKDGSSGIVYDSTGKSLCSFSIHSGCSSLRFSNSYILVSGGKILNIYAARSGHDSDFCYMYVWRLFISDDGIVSIYSGDDYSYVVSGNLFTSWNGNYTCIYPHPVYPNVVVLICTTRRSATKIGFINVNNKSISMIYSTEVSTTSSSGYYGNGYDYTNGQWCDTVFTLQDTGLSNYYIFSTEISSGTIISVNYMKNSTFGSGFKSLSLDYVLSNKTLYNRAGDIVANLSQLGNYSIVNQIGTKLYIWTLSGTSLYKYEYPYMRLLKIYNTNVTTPFNNQPSYKIFSTDKISHQYGDTGGYLVFLNEETSSVSAIDYKNIRYYNTTDTDDTTNIDLLDGKIAYTKARCNQRFYA